MKKMLKLESLLNFTMYSELLAMLPSPLKVFISIIILSCTLIPSESCKHLSFTCNTRKQIANFFSKKGILYFYTGFVRVLENLESPGIFLWHFPGLESPGKRLLVLESSGNLFNSSKKYEMYGRQ